VPGIERTSGAAALTAVPEVLATGRIEVLGLLPNASNAALLVRCGDGEDAMLAVYKPQRGETPLWDFPEGTLHRREVAAFEVARALGWPAVPATVLREGPEGPGSVQRLVRFDPAHHYFTLEADHRDAFARVAMFDMVINNADRKGGHCLLGEDGAIWVIDHGVCFAVEPKIRTVIWDFIGEPIPADAAEDLARAADDLAGGGPLAARLRHLLHPEEVEATHARAKGLLASGVFPEPDPMRRPFPWPPI
jgi:uncharacterized repeat protein (TIGR03843 family)